MMSQMAPTKKYVVVDTDSGGDSIEQILTHRGCKRTRSESTTMSEYLEKFKKEKYKKYEIVFLDIGGDKLTYGDTFQIAEIIKSVNVWVIPADIAVGGADAETRAISLLQNFGTKSENIYIIPTTTRPRFSQVLLNNVLEYIKENDFKTLLDEHDQVEVVTYKPQLQVSSKAFNKHAEYLEQYTQLINQILYDNDIEIN